MPISNVQQLITQVKERAPITIGFLSDNDPQIVHNMVNLASSPVALALAEYGVPAAQQVADVLHQETGITCLIAEEYIFPVFI